MPLLLRLRSQVLPLFFVLVDDALVLVESVDQSRRRQCLYDATLVEPIRKLQLVDLGMRLLLVEAQCSQLRKFFEAYRAQVLIAWAPLSFAPSRQVNVVHMQHNPTMTAEACHALEVQTWVFPGTAVWPVRCQGCVDVIFLALLLACKLDIIQDLEVSQLF